jgi:hypothetical protein
MYGDPHEVDYAGTLYDKQQRYRTAYPRDDDDLIGRLVAALRETAELQWVRQQLETEARWNEREKSRAASFGPGDEEDEDSEGDEEERAPVRHRDFARMSHDESDQWQQQVDEQADEGTLEEHEIGQGRRLHADDMQAEEEPVRTWRGRRSKERSRFHVVKPDPRSGKPIHASQFIHQHRQDEPATGAILESSEESIITAVHNGSMNEAEGKAALDQLRRHLKQKIEFNNALIKEFGPAQSVVDTSVRHDAERSESPEGPETEDEAFSFAQRALTMNQQSRAQQAFAHGQRVRHAKKIQAQAYRAPGWITASEGPLSSKEAALALARHCLATGENYERTLSELPA